MKILFLESFYGGSHKEFADGLRAASRHSIDLTTLPARFWKWRVRGAALYFVQKTVEPQNYDGVIVGGLINLADLKAAWGKKCPPILIYLHENQLSYPVLEEKERDWHFGFTDFTNALVADKVVFNSCFHKKSFFTCLPAFLRRMPDFKLTGLVCGLAEKSTVIYPGCRLVNRDTAPSGLGRQKIVCQDKAGDRRVPLIIWNHRWEFDKQPELFFKALYRAKEQNLAFRLACLGENSQSQPRAFIKARRCLGKQIVSYGYAADRRDYTSWLKQGDIAVSAAIQENFGVAMVEAAFYGCRPLLPRRLSYPEVFPEAYHDQIFYDRDRDLPDRLITLLRQWPRNRPEPLTGLAEAMGRYAWPAVIDRYDRLFDEVFR